MRKLLSSTSRSRLQCLVALGTLFLFQCENSSTAQTIPTNSRVILIREARQPSSPPATHGHFDDQAAVRLTSQKTNDLFSAYDRVLAAAIQKRWRELLDQRSEPPPAGSATLEFRVHSDGRVTHLLTVENSGDTVFALLAQKAVLDPAPYENWPRAMKQGHTNENRIVRLSFLFEEKAK